MFVGESGVQRIVQRTCELMKEHKTDDVRALGAIDLATIQKYLNFHCSVSLDLFGQEASTNAANYYTMGVKGRYLETRIEDDHVLTDATFDMDTAQNGRIVRKTVSALAALNERLRGDYLEDCTRGLLRWNRVIEQAGIDFELKLPHRAFHRRIGAFAELFVSPEGKVIMEGQRLEVAADRRGPNLRHLADGPGGDRARQVRQLDRPTRTRHQQPAGQFRVRALQLREGRR